MESLMREKKLYNASIKGDVNSLYQFSDDDFVSLTGFCLNGTPLHIAATRGHVDFAEKLLERKPQLVSELDSRLRSPLHLASANGRVEMVKLLLRADKNVCLIMDEFGRTPLHLAVLMNGGVEVVSELVRAGPQAIMNLLSSTKTVTILHSYVLRNGVEALELFANVDAFLCSQDQEGNTILHRAVAMNKLEMLEYLIPKNRKNQMVAVNMKNQNNLTALDLINQMPTDSRTTSMRKRLTRHSDIEYRNWFDEKKNSIMIVATVIAGMSYQAGLSPPGGVWDQDHDDVWDSDGNSLTVTAGTSIMAVKNPNTYILFWAFNTASFIAALSVVLLLILGSPSKSQENKFQGCLRRLYMGFLTCVLWVTATTTVLAYTFATLGITPDSHWGETGHIVVIAVFTWLGLIFIVCLINGFQFFTRVTKTLVPFIKRNIPSKNVNELERPQDNNNTTTTNSCCFA